MIDMDAAMTALDCVALTGCGVACWLTRRAIRAKATAERKLAAVINERPAPRRGPFPPPPAPRIVRVPQQLPARVEDACTIVLPAKPGAAVDATRLDIAAWRVPTVGEMQSWTRHASNGRTWAAETATGEV